MGMPDREVGNKAAMWWPQQAGAGVPVVGRKGLKDFAAGELTCHLVFFI